uniref:Uncharacterized protein n=1 Tax=viral metagenome TaxID=1070528 RepID=A0A6M3KRV6_9ZZZZ
MKVNYELRKTNAKGYSIDYRVIKKDDYYISQFKPQGDTRWARLYSHISLESAIKRINEP